MSDASAQWKSCRLIICAYTIEKIKDIIKEEEEEKKNKEFYACVMCMQCIFKGLICQRILVDIKRPSYAFVTITCNFMAFSPFGLDGWIVLRKN